ncbi:MAG: signal peptidase [Candidatus Parcubacteria bacterium]|jgi:signal peptidase I|nr:signal peptidase [Candidatus Parcubacteria bacterium]
METTDADSDNKRGGLWQSAREWIQVIVIALVISLPIRFFIAEPFVVNGASMDPTFSTGQFLIVDRLTYRFENPERGNVIVFEYPNDPRVYYIKRIIGLPGETIDIKDGRVTVTSDADPAGFTLDEPYVESVHSSHDTLHVVLGPTEYFVMGDNRAQSSDSRIWGPLDSRFIIGRPIVRLLPLTSVSILPGEHNDYAQ